MSLLHQVTESIRTMVGVPKGVPFNPLAALEKVAKVMLVMHGSSKALEAERELYRHSLCAIAMDFGLSRDGWDGPPSIMPTLAVLEWAPDLEKKPEEEPKRIVEVPKGLVSLH